MAVPVPRSSHGPAAVAVMRALMAQIRMRACEIPGETTLMAVAWRRDGAEVRVRRASAYPRAARGLHLVLFFAPICGVFRARIVSYVAS